MNNLSSISITILAKNAQKTLKECLEALKDFDEIILLDNESSDDTQLIAQGFPNVKIYSSAFIGFGALKNLAISYAKNDWILSIDSDEILEEDAKQMIATMNLQTDTIYALPRKNLYKNEWIKACGWYPDYVWRLFNRTFTHFNDNVVHESIIIPQNARTLKLQSGIKHYAYESIYSLIEKMQRYSNLWAEQNLHREVSMAQSIFRGSWSFFRNYFFKKGIFYGYKGFIISFCNALGTFIKYAKLYELKYSKPTSCSLIITTYNQKERLSLVLDSVKKLSVLPNEVLIADDGSTEDTAQLIGEYQKTFPCPLLHIWQEDKGFRASAIRNKAIEKAQSQYLIIIDGDMVLEPHFISDHLNFACHKVLLQGSRIILDSTKTNSLLESKNTAGGGDN